MKKNKNSKGKGKIVIRVITILMIIAVITICGLLIYNDYRSRVYLHCEVEAGTDIVPEDFLRSEGISIEYAEGSPVADPTKPGDQTLILRSDYYKYTVTLTVVDTVAPVADVREVKINSGDTVSPSDFVTNIYDETEVQVRLENDPDLTSIGQQPVVIILTDLGDNVTKLSTTLMINPVRTELTIEAGSNKPKLADVLLIEGADAQFAFNDGLDEALVHVGDYDLGTVIGGDTYYTVLHVIDTVAPAISVTDISAFSSAPLTVEDFITDCYDVTDVEYRYENDPDMTLEGTQEVVVVAIDEGGNETKLMSHLTLKADTEAPVFSGLQDIIVYAGNAVSYKKGVTVTDNADLDIGFDVDTSGVNLNEEGVYTARYIAEDRAGNRTVEFITVTVQKCSYSEAEVYAIADGILSTIITDNMSDYDKIKAIFNWAHSKIAYAGHTDKGDWLKAAYEGMVDKSGDCYAYFAVAKALLTRAGIANRDIEKIPSKTMHYWNLVNIGEGWRHFDTCPRKDHPNLFYLTDEELMDYSSKHNLSHNYDKTIYTDIS